MACATAGCTTLTDTSQSLGDHLGISNTSGAAATGGAILGCVGGAAVGATVGAFTGHPLEAAAIGCGGGALALGYISPTTLDYLTGGSTDTAEFFPEADFLTTEG